MLQIKQIAKKYCPNEINILNLYLAIKVIQFDMVKYLEDTNRLEEVKRLTE